MNIDHIAIWTLDLEKEKDFYLKYFDCNVNEKYVNPLKKFSSYFISFPAGSRIELMRREDMNQVLKGEIPGLAHFAINAGSREQVRRLTERLESDGFIISSHPRITGDGYYESIILDPENNIIEITSL